jgi:hypothetical protein
MSYYKDLSEYRYHGDFHRPGTKNVGWLGPAYRFETSEPTEGLLDKLWSYCAVSIAQMRGLHACEFCPDGKFCLASRNNQTLLLGSAEIRVFSNAGAIYAAPNLIYHYVLAHHYSPPEVFVAALQSGPNPGTQEYANRLSELNLRWDPTLTSLGKPFRFVRDGDEIKKVETEH